jgi:hypothetical protein
MPDQYICKVKCSVCKTPKALYDYNPYTCDICGHGGSWRSLKSENAEVNAPPHDYPSWSFIDPQSI